MRKYAANILRGGAKPKPYGFVMLGTERNSDPAPNDTHKKGAAVLNGHAFRSEIERKSYGICLSDFPSSYAFLGKSVHCIIDGVPQPYARTDPLSMKPRYSHRLE